ncbi:LLM class F420-dependent oxidoreductase, partial [Mycobacterium sp. ITM-2017-0098]
DHIQDLYLAGKKAEAIDAVPDELVRQVSLVGPAGFVKERLAAITGERMDQHRRHAGFGERRETAKFVEHLQDLLP